MISRERMWKLTCHHWLARWSARPDVTPSSGRPQRASSRHRQDDERPRCRHRVGAATGTHAPGVEEKSAADSLGPLASPRERRGAALLTDV